MNEKQDKPHQQSQSKESQTAQKSQAPTILKSVAALEVYRREIKTFYVYVLGVLALFIAAFISFNFKIGFIVVAYTLLAGLLGGIKAKKEADRLNKEYDLKQADIFSIFKKN